MNKTISRSILGIALALTLALTLPISLLACTASEVGGESAKIQTIRADSQTSNGVRVTNYQAILADNVDWFALPTSEKQDIINYVIDEARSQARDAGTNNFNILGTNNSSQTLFYYDRDKDNVIVYDESGAPLPDRLQAPELK
jgi:hypothetical protein